ncbi:hypothetical protein ACJ73_09896 [Blastomyces percursus]|uniref:Uncharacterized protein n=1 Tax=Blastomyces percursus TaxID=1658174 RepID=A0A1J9Q4W2_9EURO|nr:hypothetical protein ACJ73_09896 [Blastomyces percursus]
MVRIVIAGRLETPLHLGVLFSLLDPSHKLGLIDAMALGQACPPEYQRVQCAFSAVSNSPLSWISPREVQAPRRTDVAFQFASILVVHPVVMLPSARFSPSA